MYLTFIKLQSFSVLNYSLITLSYMSSKYYLLTVVHILILFFTNYSLVIFLLFSILTE